MAAQRWNVVTRPKHDVRGVAFLQFFQKRRAILADYSDRYRVVVVELSGVIAKVWL